MLVGNRNRFYYFSILKGVPKSFLCLLFSKSSSDFETLSLGSSVVKGLNSFSGVIFFQKFFNFKNNFLTLIVLGKLEQTLFFSCEYPF